jgi:hypothetical protein
MGTGRHRPLLRRLLLGGGTALAFLLLAVLGLGLGSLLTPGDGSRPEPEAPPVTRPLPPPVAEPPPPPPRPPTPQPVAAPLPAPPPAPAPAARPLLPAPAPLAFPARLKARREILRDISALKDELARCPTDKVARTSPGGRAALVLDAVAEAGAVRVVNSRLEADSPVNDRFVSCARSVLEGKPLVVTGISTGQRFRVFIPLGPNGNSLSLPAATLADAEP